MNFLQTLLAFIVTEPLANKPGEKHEGCGFNHVLLKDLVVQVSDVDVQHGDSWAGTVGGIRVPSGAAAGAHADRRACVDEPEEHAGP